MLLCLSLLAALTTSLAPEQYALEGKLLIPEASHARVFLNAGEYVSIPKGTGDFSFSNLISGTYMMTVESVNYKFQPIRIEIQQSGRIRCRYLFQGGAVIPLPLKLAPELQYDFFEPVAPFNPFAFFRNPMIILMIFTLGLGLVLPKLIDNIDSEELNRARMSSASEIQSTTSS